MERKPKIYRYYAIKQGNSVLIRRSFSEITKIRCTLTVPRMLESPTTLDDGMPNKGIKISQVCYTGGEVAGILPRVLFNQKVTDLRYAEEGSCLRLTPTQKKTVKDLLENSKG